MAKRPSFKKTAAYRVLTNRYFIATASLLVWLAFFDRNDFLTTYSYRSKLNQLHAEKAYYEEEIAKNRIALERLRTNPENLERFARETYLMKKDDEDIFVVMREEERK